MASQYAPAPRASSNRPPLSRSRLAALRASTTGGRSGRLRTFGARRMTSVRAATYDSSVQVSTNCGRYGWSWKVTRSRPARSDSCARATATSGLAADGVRNEPKSRSWLAGVT